MNNAMLGAAYDALCNCLPKPMRSGLNVHVQPSFVLVVVHKEHIVEISVKQLVYRTDVCNLYDVAPVSGAGGVRREGGAGGWWLVGWWW